MTKTNTGAAGRGTLSVRSGVSRKTLTAKAIKNIKAAEPGEALEDCFPLPADTISDQPGAPQRPIPATVAQLPAATATWSDEDEAALRTLLARRKAAGFQRRGRDVGSQLLSAGRIKPNPETVAATIVGLIGEGESATRAGLIELMASATFPHPKAQPKDKGWCQGYVAGLIRSGFLAVIEQTPALTSEASC